MIEYWVSGRKKYAFHSIFPAYIGDRRTHILYFSYYQHFESNCNALQSSIHSYTS